MKSRYNFIQMGSKLGLGQCCIHAQSRLREYISHLQKGVAMLKELAYGQVTDDTIKFLLMGRKRSQCICASEKINQSALL